MGRYDVYAEPRKDYISISLGPPEDRTILYVPAPQQNEQMHPKLVESVLEQIARQHNLDAQVKDGHIMLRMPGGGRKRPCAAPGMPTERDVRAALMRAGYRA